MLYEDYCKRLMEIVFEKKRFFLIDESHPLEIYIGMSDEGCRTFLIRNAGKVDINLIKSTASIHVTTLERDGAYSLAFMLKAFDQKEVFDRLCHDMLESSRRSDKKALGHLLNRYLAWFNLLKGSRPEILSEQEQRGLIGELLCLKEVIELKGAFEAVTGWCGPNGSDQDFCFKDIWIEVKTTKLAADKIGISSLEQLSVLTPGLLKVYRVEKTTPNDEDVFSLAQIVSTVRKRISDAALLIIFEEKLALARFTDDEPVYHIMQYKLYRSTSYQVSEKFPRLTPASVPSEITAASYDIDLAAIDAFRVEEL